MKDNVIPFPNSERRNRLQKGDETSLSSQVIQGWKEGLQDSYEKQWKTFESMYAFLDDEVQEIIEEFLIDPQGDMLLKTRLLQKLSQYGKDRVVKVEKLTKYTAIKLSEVPIEREEWPEELLKPIHLLEEYVFHDPVLNEMCKELWFYFLEKIYPFFPDITYPLHWTAAIHYYTLNLIDDEYMKIKLKDLANIYSLTQEELIQHVARFEQALLQL
jgi:hypothetical protein